MDDIRIVVEDIAFLPVRHNSGDAGADLRAAEDALILPGMCVNVSTGIRIAIPYRFGGFIFPRSGLATKYGIRLANGVGVIDCEYRGPVKVPLRNDGSTPYQVKRGDRIAQLVIMQVGLPGFLLVDELTGTVRGEGGFGSTGV